MKYPPCKAAMRTHDGLYERKQRDPADGVALQHKHTTMRLVRGHGGPQMMGQGILVVIIRWEVTKIPNLRYLIVPNVCNPIHLHPRAASALGAPKSTTSTYFGKQKDMIVYRNTSPGFACPT